MGEDLNEPTINIRPMEISVLRVGNKQMTISVFNQLYEEKPFDQNFNIHAELWGKVNRNDSYLIFKTTAGIRKYNIREFDRPIRANKLSVSIWKALAIREKSFELDQIGRKLRDYYSDKESEEDSIYGYITQLTTDPYFKSDERYIALLEQGLYGDFKIEVQNEYNLGIEKLNKRNALIEVFEKLPQLFIAV